MAVRRNTKPKAAKTGLRDVFADHLRKCRSEWTKRGSPAWLVDNVYPPDRIAALDDGRPVEVYAWEIRPLLSPADRRFVTEYRYMLDESGRLCPVPWGDVLT
jgi:hypothetical protein